LWNAFQAGFYYALAMRVGLGAPSQERTSTQNHFGQQARRFAERLSVTDAPEVPRPADASAEERSRALFAGVERLQTVSVGIEARHGRSVAAAYSLAFRVVLAPEYVPFLSTAKRDEALGEISTAAQMASLPSTIAAPLEQALREKASSEKTINVVADIHDSVLGFLERQLVHDPTYGRRRANLWEMTTTVALAALGRSEGAPPELVERMFSKSVVIARSMDLKLAVIPEESADKATTRAHILHYLLHEVGETLAEEIGSSYGPSTTALMELALKSSIALLLYSPEDPTKMSQSLADAMARSGQAAGLPPELWRDSVALMKKGSPYEEVKARIGRLHREVADYLEQKQAAAR
jgi:hypothetical protein